MDKKLEQLQENVAYTWAAYDAADAAFEAAADAYKAAAAADTTAYDAYDRARKELSEYLKEQDK